MSGIVGIAHSDGRPVSPSLLREMTSWLAFRGPDEQKVWVGGSVGLGCALLRTTVEAGEEHQPATVDRGSWIVADARLDAREELVASLRARGGDVRLIFPDSLLLLHAYQIWGESCVEYLLGDFAFAIWDARQGRLFCACDPFGIKPLYFSRLGSCFTFSNTLDCMRLHPAVSDRLNDAAIADFLLFGLNYDPATTVFADIQRLPRAHTLVWSERGLALKEYWRPPTDGSIRYARQEEYIEHFREVLTKAVEDRLRTDKVGILLSGGLDSSAVAATARNLQRSKIPSLELHAFTEIYQQAPGDGDARAAKVAAAHLGMPVSFWAVDGVEPFADWDHPDFHWPEPNGDPFAAGIADEYREISKQVRVLLSGEGSDNLMDFEMRAHCRGLWLEHRFGQLLRVLAGHVGQRFHAPDGLRGPLRRIARLFRRGDGRLPFPGWIHPSLVARFELRERWDNPLAQLPGKAHPLHPRSYASLFFPLWAHLFEETNPGRTRQPVEVRYPFLDLRVVNYLLGIPALPWFFRKHLLREATKGSIPEEIRLRPKTPLSANFLASVLSRCELRRMTTSETAEELRRYVKVEDIPHRQPSSDFESVSLRLRPRCLNFWLCSYQKNGYRIWDEGIHAKTAGSGG